MKLNVPNEIKSIAQTLEKAGYQAYLVGGCVRDMLLPSPPAGGPKDWDVATNATPSATQEIFPDSVYENDFGTVGVKTDSENPKLKVIEVTTFRVEGKYTDKRHPDEVKFAQTIEEDLSRRDFTVNALAINFAKGKFDKIIDPFGGEKDLKENIVKTVGLPDERFKEDALRLMRAVRLATELSSFSAGGGPSSGWQIELNTRRAIEKNAGLLETIAKERIRDELIKILMAPRAAEGVILLEELNLLKNIIPELREGLGCGQNKHHIYTVFEHNIRALAYTAKQNYSLLIRLASLLHDVGKPATKRGDGPDSTFHGHEVVGGRITAQIVDRLRFPKDFGEKVVHLVRQHLFYYNVDEVTAAGVRRFLARVGPENIDDLIKVREADRIGSGVPKAVPYKLRHLLFMIDKVKSDPISPKMLKVNGADVMQIAKLDPSPKVGFILSILLEEVLDDPEKNTHDHLESRIQELNKLSEKELKAMSEKAKETKLEYESEEEDKIKSKHHVK
ncbi:MAG: HD domain-containing protein [Patescibacteria group bacterium]